MDRISKHLFSLNGASLAVGAAGFVSAIVGMFIDVNAQISVKWLILVAWISTSLVLILLKIIHDLASEKAPPAPYENPIRSVPDDRIFVIRRNENFINSIIVGCYSQKDEVDRLAYIATVHLVQDKIIQIKIHTDMKVLPSLPTTPDELKNIIIRPVVPVSAIEQFAQKEYENE